MCVWMGWGAGWGGIGVYTPHNSPVSKHGLFFILPPFPLFWDSGNVWVKKQPSKVNWTRERWKEKKRWCQHNLRAGKTITTSASVYINPADAKHFPIFAWLAFYFNAWGETVEAILLVADFPFFYCWPSNLYKFKWAGGNCVVCMLNLCANSDLLLGELNENAVEFSIRKRLELLSKWMECLLA